MSSTAIVIFLKYPHPGEVKTRLIPGLGEIEATSFYKKCCEDLVTRLKRIQQESFLLVSNPADIPLVNDWFNLPKHTFSQEGENLGEKIKNAIYQFLQKGFHKIIIVGSDIPDLNSSHISRAEELLDDYDFILGPSFDGGYYLLGLTSKNPYEFLLSDIPWSTSQVLNLTVERILEEGYSLQKLKPLRDIDTFEDYQAWQKELAQKIK